MGRVQLGQDMTPKKRAQLVQTPASTKGTPKSFKKPASTKGTPKSVKKPASTKGTPKSVKKPTSTKGTPIRPRGKPLKPKRKLEPSADVPEVPEPLPVQEAPSKALDGNYPFDRTTRCHDTVRAAQRKMKGVLDEHVVRCTVPIVKMAAICKNLEAKMKDRRIEGPNGSRSMLEASIDEALSEICETDVQMNKSVFRQEIAKDMCIASTQLTKLSTTTLLKMVRDLNASGINTYEYEAGCPVKLPSSILQFYNLTEKEFKSLTAQTQLLFHKEFAKEGLKYHQEVEAFLAKKHKALLAKGNGDIVDPFKNYPDGRIKEGEMHRAFAVNRDLGRFKKIAYESLVSKENIEVIPYRDQFRTLLLKGQIGVRSEAEEDKLDAQFRKTPLEVVKGMVGVRKVIKTSTNKR